MTAPLTLMLFAFLSAHAGSRVLRRARWPLSTPWAGITAWLLLGISTASALLLALLSLALPLPGPRDVLARLAGLHVQEVAEHYLTPAGLPLTVLAAIGAIALIARFGWLAGRAGRRQRRLLTEHLDTLTLVARPDPGGYLVLDHPAPVAYCLPGSGTIVVSAGARARLTERQLALVLRHERAHLNLHHHLPLSLARILEETFRLPGLPLFAEISRQVAALSEMQADDSARTPAERRDLARALIILGTGRAPAPALAAGSTAVSARIRRLAAPSAQSPPDRPYVKLALAAFCLLAIPWTLALGPAAEASLRSCCQPLGKISRAAP
ncbi:M56 family metallopeptidase [Kineosporia rhizophila]|uniref:M56 family metallopeptidase n=1 Tax=Kineosporia rhizophila TaxID=84633 RepID=UPI001E5C642A|nr:M56 family metallopeptidase [Kineosporia rhizophila]MCE0536125.1 M56 family metallopeptidase [Kineosporia rhizophila]